jgi:hypothetical protein
MRSLQQSPASRPSSSSPLLLLTLIAIATFTTACGSGKGSSTAPQFSGNTQVTLVLTSSANDQLSAFDMALQSLSLTAQSGQTVNLVSVPLGLEVIHLNGQVEPLATVTVPQGIYTSGSATVGGAEFTCNTLNPLGGVDTSTFAYGFTPNSQVTVNLPSPLTITGDTMNLLVDVPVVQSASFASCYANGADPYSMTPTFNITAASLFSSQPTNPGNGKVMGMDGQLSALGSDGNSFTLSVPQGDALPRSMGITTDTRTSYQGIGGFSALAVGTFVDMDGALQPNGSILATRIAVESQSAVNTLIGPLLYVSGAEPALYAFGRDQQGSDFSDMYVIGAQNFSFDSAVFQISGEFSNVQSLPFTASFNGANMVAGQNVYLSSPKLTDTSNPYTELDAITLMPQAIDGTVLGSSTSGNFTDYTVELAPYDLFPTFAVQQAQTTLLSNPNQVEVYVDSNTQMLNSQPLAAGNTMRFYGLVFNDNGTLRMDCAQVNDGVALNPPANSNTPMAAGKSEIVRRAGAGGAETITTITRSH